MANSKFKFIPLFLLASLTVIPAFQEAPAVKTRAAEYPGRTTINVLNVEDYIYLYSEEGDAEDLTKQFEKYAKEELGFEDPKVVYNTTPTPETMLNELQTERASYDLLCPSDYMIERMADNGLLEKLDGDLLPNYNQYTSVRIREYLDNCFTRFYDEGEDIKEHPYAVGYMWGTLGILFNPTYKGQDYDKAMEDMQDWSVLWNKDYNSTISIKDSMRDTFAVALMYSYTDDYERQTDAGIETLPGFKTLTETYNALENPTEEETVTYNLAMSKLFNMDDEVVTSKDAAIQAAAQNLNNLKANIYGLEVDTGKNDILTNKIGINLAWSGDAVYSMDLGEQENDLELYYSVPKYGSNIWFDGWCMPKRDNRTEPERKLAHAFLDFISMPENATQNMNYTGYTSFIGGDDILNLARDWYDYRTDLIYNEGEDEEWYSLFYEDPNDEELFEVWYEDCAFEEDQDPDYDDVQLYYGYCDYDEDGNLINIETGDPLTTDDLDEFEGEFYNARLTIPEDIEVVDLTYFFDGTLSDEMSEDDMIFYSDCYLPFENSDGSHNISVGRQFFTQYPDEGTIVRCAVMKDFGEYNNAITKMWEKFKSTALPVWAIVLFVVEIAAILGVCLYFVINKSIKKSLKKKGIR